MSVGTQRMISSHLSLTQWYQDPQYVTNYTTIEEVGPQYVTNYTTIEEVGPQYVTN